MAIPSQRQSSTGATDAGGAWSYTCAAPLTGNVLVVSFLQDGTTNGAITSVVGTNIENLAGTDNAWTQVTGPNGDGSWPVGNPAAARQFIYIGRALSTSQPTISGANSTSEDLYIQANEFNDVSTGTTLATVIENSTAGNAVNGTGTSTTVSDTGVTTLGTDRLALNLIAINDDASGLAAFAGASGGTWSQLSLYEDASGTDGTVSVQAADMTSAGTIDGGSDTITSLAWGVVGFALIGTTPAAAFAPPPRSFYLGRPHIHNR